MSDTHYGTYAEYKGYTTPVVRDKHIRRLDAEFWAPMACTTEMSVLEIGCGTGLFLAYLSARGVENFTGIDSDPALQGVIPEPVAGRFRVAEAMAFLDQAASGPKFDRVVMFDVFEHFTVEDGLSLLKRLRQCLANDGRILLKMPNAASPWGQQFQYGDLTHRAAYTPSSIRQQAIAAGFDCLSVFPHYLGSPIRQRLDKGYHWILGKVLATPLEIWTGNFFTVLTPKT